MKRIKDMSDEQKKRYLTYYNDVMLSGKTGFTYLQPSKEFDDFGLRFPIDYLNAIGKNVVFFPIEIAAEYVDFVTKTAIDNDDKEFLFHQIIDQDFNIEDETAYQSINATTIGNLAYISEHCKDARTATIAEELYNKIFVKEKGKVLAFMNENI